MFPLMSLVSVRWFFPTLWGCDDDNFSDPRYKTLEVWKERWNWAMNNGEIFGDNGEIFLNYGEIFGENRQIFLQNGEIFGDDR